MKILVCDREKMWSRNRKDSSTVFISGGRHENCVLSLKDYSGSYRSQVEKWLGAFSSFCCKWWSLFAVQVQEPTAAWTALSTRSCERSLSSGTAAALGRWDTWECYKLWHMPVVQAVGQSQSGRAPAAAENRIHHTFSPEPWNPFVSPTAPNFSFCSDYRDWSLCLYRSQIVTTSKTATDMVLLAQLSDLQSKKPKRGRKADIFASTGICFITDLQNEKSSFSAR